MHTHTRCISVHAQGLILFLESALPLSSGTWAMGTHGPFRRTMVIQTLEMKLCFCPFKNREWSAWLLDVHAASLPWAVGWGPAFRKTCQSLQAERYMWGRLLFCIPANFVWFLLPFVSYIITYIEAQSKEKFLFIYLKSFLVVYY